MFKYLTVWWSIFFCGFLCSNDVHLMIFNYNILKTLMIFCHDELHIVMLENGYLLTSTKSTSNWHLQPFAITVAFVLFLDINLRWKIQFKRSFSFCFNNKFNFFFSFFLIKHDPIFWNTKKNLRSNKELLVSF